jgi:hypothetical protein
LVDDRSDRDFDVAATKTESDCSGLPQLRLSKATAADTGAAGGAFSALAMPANTLMPISV